MNRETIALIEAEYRRYEALGRAAFGQLDTSQITAASGESNSIATIVWHMSGNLQSRFTDFLESDGEKPWRAREEEFATRKVSTAVLLRKWDEGWNVLLATLASLTDADLGRSITIRGVVLRVDEALFRSLAHISYHVGQIVYVAKGFRAEQWRYLSIPPGGTAAYNSNPTLEKADQLPARSRDEDGRRCGEE